MSCNCKEKHESDPSPGERRKLERMDRCYESGVDRR